jgi:hypothetical protein
MGDGIRMNSGEPQSEIDEDGLNVNGLGATGGYYALLKRADKPFFRSPRARAISLPAPQGNKPFASADQRAFEKGVHA